MCDVDSRITVIWCMLNGNLKSKDPVMNSKDDFCCMRNHTIVILYYTCLSIK